MRKILSILLIAMIILSLSACGAPSAPTTGSGANGQDQPAQSAPVKEPEKNPSIEVGQTSVVDDYCEFTVKETKFGKKIMPPNPGTFYTYYEAKEDGEIYLDTIISIKSLLTSGQSSDEFAYVKIIYADKYEYDTFAAIEDGGGSDFTYTNITPIEPLKSGTLHFLATVPEEVEKSSEALKIVVNIKGKDYELKIR